MVSCFVFILLCLQLIILPSTFLYVNPHIKSTLQDGLLEVGLFDQRVSVFSILNPRGQVLPKRLESNYISPAECASCFSMAMIAILCIFLFFYLSFVNLFPSTYSSIYSWLLGHLNLLIKWFKGPVWLLLGHKKGLGSLEETLKWGTALPPTTLLLEFPSVLKALGNPGVTKLLRKMLAYTFILCRVVYHSWPSFPMYWEHSIFFQVWEPFVTLSGVSPWGSFERMY